LLDKNPEKVLTADFQEILREFSSKNPNIVLSSEPFLKSQFLIDLINSSIEPVIFLDFDLLYSGYVYSGMLTKNNRVEIYQPDKNNIKKIFSDVANKISNKKHLVILDSFNGFYNIFTEMESGIFINAITMLLSFVAREKDSMIIVSGMARKKNNEDWVLLPGGRHMIESKNSGMYFLKRDERLDFKITKFC
jgi:hypothetical protein